MSCLLVRPVRASLFRPLSRATTTRPGLAVRYSSSSSFQTSPSPPRLPADQQAEFERLQRAAEAALSSHTTIPAATDSPLSTSRHVSTPSSSSSPDSSSQAQASTTTEETMAAGSFSGGMRKGAPPEFAGDKNPRTGEVGGPKNEPLRWGGEGDWSFNGRVTDF